MVQRISQQTILTDYWMFEAIKRMVPQGGFHVQSLLNTTRNVVLGTLKQGEYVVSAAVHAVGQPVSDMITEGKHAVSGVHSMLKRSSAMIHVAVGVTTGYVVWETLQRVAPNLSAEIGDTLALPFKRRRLLER